MLGKLVDVHLSFRTPSAIKCYCSMCARLLRFFGASNRVHPAKDTLIHHTFIEIDNQSYYWFQLDTFPFRKKYPRHRFDLAR
ncbi:hypothetical protein [Brevibacillus parabrevis]|uniref:hypothetical protein n=1 Tax=Brevibacillus parabrevis TaxID=54914 RepID=UPI0018DD2A65|nr:hypothetical protein [Brevibacillus parabrevis]